MSYSEGVQEDRLSIDELADAAGLTRRGIRFYVQQRLLPTPHGVGRGKHYDASHLARLRVMEGVELTFDAGRFNPSVEQLVALREMIASVFRDNGD